MKITAIIATALVLPSYGFVVPSTTPRTNSFLAISYLDELELSSPAAEATRPMTNFPNEDAETIALANQLGIDDNVVRNEYGRWLARYNKNFDITRYSQFKKNWLQQFSHDVKYGKFYTLNEFGDCSEEEYRQMMSKMETPAVVTPAAEATITKKAKKTRGPSTQPKPAFVMAVNSCTNLFKKNIAKFVDISGGFRNLSELGVSYKKGKKN
ncbi:unnamed protein product [Cylindrotheca closterium]|uniref:RxLR effector protein n=1 Tax=Cylindrotheca closterium TaxID=2856 RepID=A0AAD2PUQ0_9STRA|nr:unnamed protein product [Cylindrotheca closterium]